VGVESPGGCGGASGSVAFGLKLCGGWRLDRWVGRRVGGLVEGVVVGKRSTAGAVEHLRHCRPEADRWRQSC